MDAILVARSIPVPYLWIDVLCILQDVEEDKVKEIAYMDRIYRNSFVSIAAACDSDANQGFLHTRPPDPTKTFEVPYGIGGGLFSTISMLERWHAHYEDGIEPLMLELGLFKSSCLRHALSTTHLTHYSGDVIQASRT
ncbi:hypothetical protein BCR34DRAFT_555507 [Clohesyomyces aquaticus]|uniref:Heterokaryon incompatibility domain-containing protein n=1 Tax=Clohesyomyces aquaticus TaxID=1231657 RepID=A0A1Y2A4N9_9PLEO|nr:hypothetical protein BCR34DRAFT_555507 [Clohesyomyces aquaticus]